MTDYPNEARFLIAVGEITAEKEAIGISPAYATLAEITKRVERFGSGDESRITRMADWLANEDELK